MKIILFEEDIAQLYDGFKVTKLVNQEMVEIQLINKADIVEDRANDYE